MECPVEIAGRRSQIDHCQRWWLDSGVVGSDPASSVVVRMRSCWPGPVRKERARRLRFRFLVAIQ
ncbi:hypothetical protein [Lysobacter gummosus]|uniref:hypothetical protein n=1 Tax=Lysobacter gummosus TaxID=262324 RepID=UPI003626EA11